MFKIFYLAWPIFLKCNRDFLDTIIDRFFKRTKFGEGKKFMCDPFWGVFPSILFLGLQGIG